MKTLSLILLLLTSFVSHAIEIQCHDPAGINFTIVTSKKTNVTYFVCDDGVNLIRYVPLYDELLKTEGTQIFSYDENILYIKVEGNKGVARTLEGRDLCAGYTRLHSDNCSFFVDSKEVH